MLLPASIALLAESPCHVAPPVAPLSLIVALTALTVPVVCEIVARSPLVVAPSVTKGEPEMAKVPALLVAPDLNWIVPAVSVSVRVAPSVKASLKICVDPGALNVTGRSSVLPLKVCVTVPLVATKLVTAVWDEYVAVAESVSEP